MYYAITGGSLAYGADTVLSDLRFEIKNREKVALVGRNGCGKTTLLNFIAGELDPQRDENGNLPAVSRSKGLNIGFLRQISFEDLSVTMEDEVKKAFSNLLAMQEEMDRLTREMEHSADTKKAARYTELAEEFRLLGGYTWEKEFETVIKKLGFCAQDKGKKLSEFSGGQLTKLSFAKLLLSKPDLLLLDEPTNHLDMGAVSWLETYLKNYPRAVLIVSHDQMFLDRVVSVVYEIAHGHLHRYTGNYSDFVRLKKETYEKQKKDYEARQKEVARITATVERFRYKATKAAMAQSKLKALDRMEPIEAPEEYDLSGVFADLTPQVESGNTVLSVHDLQIGYDHPLSRVNLELKKGQKIGIIGSNGLGKSTFLKTLMGKIPPISGRFDWGVQIRIGYFDQHLAQYTSEKTVLDDYWDTFPDLTQTQARNDLGAFLFRGEDVFKAVDVLSGGEKVRLCLCKIFKNKPNVLILDEPTNHMDIVGKESLESMLAGYPGTLLCVSHDRYFISRLCDCLLVFENGQARYYPESYPAYEESRASLTEKNSPQTNPTDPSKNPVENSPEKEASSRRYAASKELAKIKRRLAQLEEEIALKEEEVAGIRQELALPENATDYEKLSALQAEIEEREIDLSVLMDTWEAAEEKKQELQALISPEPSV